MTRDGYWVGIVTADSPPFGRAASAEAVLRRLLEWGVPVLMHNIAHQNIVRAIKSVEPVTLRKLLQICDASQWGAEIGRSSFIRMPMEYALRTRNVAVVRELLRAGVRPDAEINFTETVLHRAAKQGLDEIVAELLAAGAKPDLKNHEGTTPLMLAAALGRIETVRVLLAAGADPGLRDESGRSAHMQARTPEVAKLLATRAPAPR